MGERKVEAYIGEYASGKSEVALNRALDLAKQGEKVTLVDMDLVEPCYCVRGVKSLLDSRGVEVVPLVQKGADNDATYDESCEKYSAEAKKVLEREGNIIFDVGFGGRGAKLLHHIQGFETDPDLKMILVLNTNRKVTCGVEEALEYVKRFWRLDCIISNTHNGKDTTEETVLGGLEIAKTVAAQLNVPLVGVGLSKKLFREDEKLIAEIGAENIRWLRNWMPKSI